MRNEFQNHEAWHNRGYLPHYDAVNTYQMITYRLADSLPNEVIEKQLKALSINPEHFNEDVKKRRLIEDYLDKGYGSCVLKESCNAEIVVDAWTFFAGERYDLIAYVVMPNHVHVLIKTYAEWSLSKVIHSWKSFSSSEIRKKMLKVKSRDSSFGAGKMPALPANFSTSLWQEEYWDRFIRDKNHFKSNRLYSSKPGEGRFV